MKTEKTYIGWIKRYIYFHDKRHPKDMGENDRRTMLPEITVEALKRQLEKVKITHQIDLKAGFGSVYLNIINTIIFFMRHLEYGTDTKTTECI